MDLVNDVEIWKEFAIESSSSELEMLRHSRARPEDFPCQKRSVSGFGGAAADLTPPRCPIHSGCLYHLRGRPLSRCPSHHRRYYRTKPTGLTGSSHSRKRPSAVGLER